jgi:hypothetical protein
MPNDPGCLIADERFGCVMADRIVARLANGCARFIIRILLVPGDATIFDVQRDGQGQGIPNKAESRFGAEQREDQDSAARIAARVQLERMPGPILNALDIKLDPAVNTRFIRRIAETGRQIANGPAATG